MDRSGEIFDAAVATVLADSGVEGAQAAELDAELRAAREQALEAAEPELSRCDELRKAVDARVRQVLSADEDDLYDALRRVDARLTELEAEIESATDNARGLSRKADEVRLQIRLLDTDAAIERSRGATPPPEPARRFGLFKRRPTEEPERMTLARRHQQLEAEAFTHKKRAADLVTTRHRMQLEGQRLELAIVKRMVQIQTEDQQAQALQADVNAAKAIARTALIERTLRPVGERWLQARQRADERQAEPPADPSPAARPSFFISYSHADGELAARLQHELEDRGARVWRDKTSLAIGDSLSKAIPEAISESDFMVLLVSEASLASNWHQRELALAVAHGIDNGRVKVLPLRVGAVEMPVAIRDALYMDVDDATVADAATALMKAAAKHRAHVAAPEPRS